MTRMLALWSAPRSRSTAFLTMMAQRGDYFVLHEPFSHVADFGSTTVGDRVVRSEAELIAALRELVGRTPVFFKDTTDFRYPGVLADQAFLAEVTHTFLIRHPAEAIASHFALNRNLGRDEIGFAWLADIYDAVARRTGTAQVVVDSDDLIANPEATVAEYCRQVGIPFLPEALQWLPGMREDWRKTRDWHEATSQTSGFAAARPAYRDTVGNNPVLSGYLDYHLPYYRKLRAHRMVVNGA
jgi:Sulfotransferase domain